MAKKQQSKHKEAVKRTAAGYKARGYNVRADNIKGYKDPKPINGRIPDVVARKGRETRITEIETKSSMKRDKKQRDTFRKYANKRKGTKFRTRKTK